MCLCEPHSVNPDASAILSDPKEIAFCEWIDLEEFFEIYLAIPQMNDLREIIANFYLQHGQEPVETWGKHLMIQKDLVRRGKKKQQIYGFGSLQPHVVAAGDKFSASVFNSGMSSHPITNANLPSEDAMEKLLPGTEEKSAAS